MKKNVLTLMVIALFLAPATHSFSQTIDISPFYGWQMNGKVKFYQGEIKTDDNPLFGATMDVMLGQGTGLRLSYSRTETTSYFRPYFGYDLDFPATDFRIANEYYQIGTIKSIAKGNIEPFGVFTLGAARYHALDLNVDDTWRFSITAGLGVKIFFNDKIGIKLQGDFMMPMYFSGVGFYFGSGGSGLSVNGYAPLIQGNFNGGFIFRLGQ